MDDDSIIATPEEWEIARATALKMAGCSLEELQRQATEGAFSSFDARLAWMVLRD